jgi:glyceraldehyde-3-phosphate dehydrogenase (NADP+)
MSQSARIHAVENFVKALKLNREEIVDVLMWEICKTKSDAAKEFDRTMDFSKSVCSYSPTHCLSAVN